MPIVDATAEDRTFMKRAWEEAEKGYQEGGVPVGAVMVEAGQVLATGRNRRFQDGDPIAHGEMDCLRRAGRRPHYEGVTLYTTLSPCRMCTGAILQFEIPRVVGLDQDVAQRHAGAALVQDIDPDVHVELL